MFEVGDRVFLRVSPLKRAMQFGRWGKLSARYIGPSKILRRVRPIAYEFSLPPAYSAIHPQFSMSMLHCYIPNESHVLWYDTVELDGRLTYVKELVAILARDTKQLHSKNILIVKVQWQHRLVE